LPPPPNPRGVGEFDAVAAVSANDVWAVGDGIGTLIEYWNGTLWSLVKSASPGTDFNNLYGVAAVSANNVWAVGSYSDNPQLPNVETLSFPMLRRSSSTGMAASGVSSPAPAPGRNPTN
jgi:arabinogalactan endo-1,4-beta-galactosidase